MSRYPYTLNRINKTGRHLRLRQFSLYFTLSLFHYVGDKVSAYRAERWFILPREERTVESCGVAKGVVERLEVHKVHKAEEKIQIDKVFS